MFCLCSDFFFRPCPITALSVADYFYFRRSLHARKTPSSIPPFPSINFVSDKHLTHAWNSSFSIPTLPSGDFIFCLSLSSEDKAPFPSVSHFFSNIFALSEFSSLSANFFSVFVFAISELFRCQRIFSLPCVSYALLTKICFWSWLQRDVILYPNTVVSLDVWNDVDADAEAMPEQINRDNVSSVRAQRDLFRFGSRIYRDTWQ